MTQTILITGATDGVGKLTAQNLAEKNHTLILHGRNSEKLKKLVSELKTSTNNENIFGVVSDFSDVQSVKKMAETLNNDFEKIDILINNAGVFKVQNPKNADGLDVRFIVNYFAPYVLTHNILPLLEKSEHPKVINLSSAAQSPVDLEALAGNKDLGDDFAYAQSKLALTMWSFAFAKKYPKIITIAVNPGSLLNTKMVQEAYGQHWAGADKGADILCDLALNPAYNDASGTYFNNDKVSFSKAHADAYDAEKMRELIEKTEEILGEYL